MKNNIGSLLPAGRILHFVTVEEFDTFLAGEIAADELRRRAACREAGREPVEPVGGTIQSDLMGWCD